MHRKICTSYTVPKAILLCVNMLICTFTIKHTHTHTHTRVFNLLPKFVTAVYNACLTKGIFPEQWKSALIMPIEKPGNDSDNATRFRPISLLNTGGKVLENLLINRIIYQLHSQQLLNPNQYGFTPQRGTVDALMAMNKYVEQSFSEGQYVILVSLDVQSAFDAAWWPSILNTL